MRQGYCSRIVILSVVGSLGLGGLGGLGGCSGNGQASKDQHEVELNTSGSKRLAVEGYDVVSYFQPTGPVKGTTEFTAPAGGATYRFASASNLASFTAEPDKYIPAYGGWCATAMAEHGGLIDIDPETYRIQDGRLYLYFNALFINARNAWEAKPAEYQRSADANWARRTGR